jgi:hypothetical protein
MNISNYLRNRALNHFFRGTASTSPATLFVGLFLNNPTAASTGTEVSGTGYIRKAVTFTAPVTEDGKQVIANATDIEFDPAGANWGNVTHAEIRDAVTAGNAYYYGALTSPKLIETNDVLRINAGELKLTLR